MKKIVLIMFLLFPLRIFGATQGTRGATSQGAFCISIDIMSSLKISKLSDIVLNYNPIDNNDLIGISQACIYSNDPNKAYKVTATSQNANSGISRVKSSTESNKFINYSVEWHDNKTATSTNFEILSSGVKSVKTFTSAQYASENCNAGNNSSIKIKFLKSNLEVASSGSYIDTLTLLISVN